MNVLLSILSGVVLIGGATIFIKSSPREPPKLMDVYWGPGEEPKETDTSIRPFKIVFEKDMLEDLRYRLNNTRKLQSPLEEVGWTYGISSHSVSNIINYWLTKYDFEKREAHLNQYPQFITNIQGLDIHFLHVKPELPKDSKIEVVPLLILHGWSGSVVEFYKTIPMLTTPRADRDFVFEVIAPSLPGFAYSQAPSKVGLGHIQMALVMKNLMLRLGFHKFYVQGGDWGAIIAADMAAMYPQHVLGLHSNLCLVMFRPWTWLKIAAYSLVPSLLPKEESQLMFPLSKLLARIIEESGYYHIQATKPDTVGVGLNDSPAALAAYIMEKFSSLTKIQNKYAEDGNILEKFTMDEYIDNLMMYWAPNSATSSLRIYAESSTMKNLMIKMDDVIITVPSACAQFPDDFIFQSAHFLRDRFVNLLRATVMPRGGHYAAFEEPQLFADDIWISIQGFRDFHVTQERLEKQKL